MKYIHKIELSELFNTEPIDVINYLNNIASMDAHEFLEYFSYFTKISNEEKYSREQVGEIAYILYNMKINYNALVSYVNKALASKCEGRKSILENHLKNSPIRAIKAENVVVYYALCNRLKNVIRTGWKDWKVNRNRIESVAEHIYGVQMLAIAMKSEYLYDVDLTKVIMMLAVHELEEVLIGDLTLFQISAEEKQHLGHEAVETVLSPLLDKNQIKALIHEFDARITKEAQFAYHCDKLECDLQSKLYDEEGCVDLNDQEGNKTFQNEEVQTLLESEKTWSGMWLEFGKKRYGYDENFTAVSDFAKENDIYKLVKNI